MEQSDRTWSSFHAIGQHSPIIDTQLQCIRRSKGEEVVDIINSPKAVNTTFYKY